MISAPPSSLPRSRGFEGRGTSPRPPRVMSRSARWAGFSCVRKRWFGDGGSTHAVRCPNRVRKRCPQTMYSDHRLIYSVCMTSQRIGYSRVSTTDQNPDSQHDALIAAECDQVFIEKYTGTKADRPVWSQVQKVLRSGDTLVITRLDRLARSSRDLIEISATLQEKGIALEATEQPIDTSTPEGRMFYAILSAFAEFEHDLIVARTKDGLAAARARGRKGGRKSALTERQAASIRKQYGEGVTVSALAEDFKVSRPTIYRALEATGA